MLRDAFDDGPIAQCLLREDGTVWRANAAFAALAGRSTAELHNLPVARLLDPGDRAALGAGAEVEHCFGERWVVSFSARIPGGVVWQCVDVTARGEDALSGVSTRRRFEAELERALAHARRYGGRVGLLLVDLDGFKAVNDERGHAAGDALLAGVGAGLRAVTRATDVVGRLGGDEFAVLLPQTDEPGAAQLAAAVLEAVREAGGTASIGAAVSADDGAEEAAVLRHAADSAMYDAKSAGGDRFALARTGRPGQIDLRAAWVERLRAAAEHDRLRLHAMPVVPFDGAQGHHELLLRYLRDDGELVVPSRFLDVAERFGLAPELDRWVLGQAVELLRARPGRRVAVNLSRATLGREAAGTELVRLLERAALPAGALTVEVTETAVVADPERAAELLGRLRALGVRVALDDFGAGATGLQELRTLPVDELKIDGAFVRGVAAGGRDCVIVEAIVHLARGLGARTVAEFVTDERTLAGVRRLGVDAAQGYHLGVPRPVEDLLTVAA